MKIGAKVTKRVRQQIGSSGEIADRPVMYGEDSGVPDVGWHRNSFEGRPDGSF